MHELIIHSIEEGKDAKDDNDKTNLLKKDIIAIFPNIKTVHINAYSFSLIGFLSVLQASEWQKVNIRGEWLSELMKTSKAEIIIKQYESKNYKIIHREPTCIKDATTNKIFQNYSEIVIV